jgi:hypothetical protein
MLLLFSNIAPYQTELRVLEIGLQQGVGSELGHILLVDFLEETHEVMLGFEKGVFFTALFDGGVLGSHLDLVVYLLKSVGGETLDVLLKGEGALV